MPWLLLLHISAMLCWCGSLLSIPPLVLAMPPRQRIAESRTHLATVRRLFTLVCTPAALVAIVAGTALFLSAGEFQAWLVLKLSLVSGLVLCHALSGFLVVRAAHLVSHTVTRSSRLLMIAMMALMSSIVWIVLSKPF